MKSPLAALLFSGSLLLGAESSLTGDWHIKLDVAGNHAEPVCTITQKELALSGTCKSEDSDHELTGSVDGKKLTWQYKINYNGDDLIVIYNGQIDSDDAISGAIDVQPVGAAGEFTATRSK